MIKAGQVGKKSDTGQDPLQWYLKSVNCDVPDDTEWDDKGRNKISFINVSFDRSIRCIQFGYMENEALVMSEEYGSSEGHHSQFVKLKQDEYVTGLSGELALCEGIRSLTFHTNRGKHGPIGNLAGSYASGSKIDIHPAISDRHEFGGFFGSYNTNCLSSIGIYASTIASSSRVD